MSAQHIVIGLGLAVALSILFGCGDHYSTQEAYDICHEQLGRNPSAYAPETFAGCVACYEDCGAECASTGIAPAVYQCPE
jgi:hypothetical protein